MRTQPRISFTAFTSLAIMILCGGFGRAAAKNTLETLCDKVEVLQTRYAPASFEESCALLERTLRQALLNSEDPHADAVRPRLTLKSTVSPPGSRPVGVSTSSLSCSIREVVRQFAAAWGVAATISDDQILFSKLPARTVEATDTTRAK